MHTVHSYSTAHSLVEVVDTTAHSQDSEDSQAYSNSHLHPLHYSSVAAPW